MMPHRKKSSKLTHFFLLPFSLCLVGGVAVSEVVLAQTAEERKAEEDRVLKSCRDNLNAQKPQEALLACQAALEDFKKTDNLRGKGIALNNISNAYNALNQYQKAIDNLQQSLKIVREVKDQRIERIVVGNLANNYEKLGNFDKAIEYRLRGLEMVREVKDLNGEVDSLYSLGNTYYALKQYQKAIEYYQQSLVIVKRLENNKSEPAINYNIGISYIALGDNAKGREFLLTAQELAKKISDRDIETKAADLLSRISLQVSFSSNISLQVSSSSNIRKVEADRLFREASQQSQISQFETALQSWQQALTIYREIKERLGEGKVLGNLGNVYQELGKYDKAIEFWMQSLAILREIKDRNGEGLVLGNLGRAYYNLGKYDKAIEYRLRGLEMVREVKDLNGEVDSLNSLGNTYYALKQYQKAIDYYQQSLVIVKQLGNNKSELTINYNIGISYVLLGEIAKGREFLLLVQELAKKIDDRDTETKAIDLLNKIRQQRKEEARLLSDQSIKLFVKQEFSQSFIKKEEALQIYREIKDIEGELKSLIHLGVSYGATKQYQKAIQYYQQSLVISEKINDHESKLGVLINLGGVYDSLKQYQKAIEYYQKALAFWKQAKNNYAEPFKQVIHSQAEPYINYDIAISYIRLNDISKAREFLLKSIESAEKFENTYIKKSATFLLNDIVKQISLGSRKSEATRLLDRGIQQYKISQFEGALQSWEQALAIYRNIRDRQGEGNTLGNLGLAYYFLGKYDKAIEFQLQSLEISREIKDRQGEGQSLGNLGIAYKALGKYDKAIEFQLQSLEISREIKDRQGEGSALGNLGEAHGLLGKYDQAVKFHLQALEILREIKDRNGEGTVLGNLGLAYRNLGKFDKAIEYQLKHSAITLETKDRQGTLNALGNLGNTYNVLGKHDQAIKFYLQFLAFARAIKDLSGEGTVLNNLAVAYEKLNRDREAMISFQQALTIAKEIGDRRIEGYALANLGNVLSKAKLPELAILFYKQAINIREAIRQDIKKLDKELQQSYLATVENTYRDLADILLQQNRIIEALQVLDLLKVQELEDYLKNIKGNDRSAQGVRLLAPEKAIGDKLLAVSFENAPELNQQLANQIQQLPKTEINKVPDYLNQIPQGTVLLYPFILGDRLEIILFAPNNPPVRRTVKITEAELKELTDDFIIDLRDSGSDDVKFSAAKLYDILIKPIEADLVQLDTKTILYAPDGQLRYIPLAALYDGKQWLAEKYQISNLIAYTLTDLRHSSRNLQPDILAGAFGGKAGESKFGKEGLPATIIEVDKIADYFQDRAIALKENQFSRQAVESKFKNHNVLHFATHAAFISGTPDQSYIIFGNGDKIRLHEIDDWQIPNMELVVLSACQTGLGDLANGIEILGFGYQLQKAGVKNSIASLWVVKDDGTQALMDNFYGSLKKGNVTVSEALQRAQISLIKSQNYDHPYYWSAFFAIGNGL